MRALVSCLGLLALAAVWLGAPGLLLPPFSAHMTQHMVVVAVAAPLLALGVAGTPLDPSLHWPRLFAVVPASIAELILVWGWHTPALHHMARHSSLAFMLEQASFLASGLWLWTSALGGERRGERGLARSGAGILALLLTSMHMTLLGALLALPPRPLYDHGAPNHSHAAAHPSASLASLAPLDDQHLGGAIMIVLGGASYLAGASWLSLGLLRRSLGRRRRPARADLPGTPAAAPSGRSGS
jgi:putative membrane protein